MRISMNTTLSRSGRVDDIKSHPQGEVRGLTKLVKCFRLLTNHFSPLTVHFYK
jgi:hypothetical protein